VLTAIQPVQHALDPQQLNVSLALALLSYNQAEHVHVHLEDIKAQGILVLLAMPHAPPALELEPRTVSHVLVEEQS